MPRNDKTPVFRLATHGLVRTGKSAFAVTAPDPIAFIPLDINTHHTVEVTAKKLGKKVKFPNRNYIALENPQKVAAMKPEQAAEYYREKVMVPLWNDYYGFLDDASVRTVAVDTADQLHENVWMSHFGRMSRIMPRDTGPANSDMEDAMVAAWVKGKNLIMVHPSKEEWKDEKPTGRMVLDGWKWVRRYSEVTVEHFRVSKSQAGKGLGYENDFAVRVTESHFNPWLVGGDESVLAGEECTFGWLVERMARVMVRGEDGEMEWTGEWQDWFDAEEWGVG
jgi:hypothetical protein